MSLPHIYYPDRSTHPMFPRSAGALCVQASLCKDLQELNMLKQQNVALRAFAAKNQWQQSRGSRYFQQYPDLYAWRKAGNGTHKLPLAIVHLVNKTTDARAVSARYCVAEELKRRVRLGQINPQYDVWLVYADKVAGFPDTLPLHAKQQGAMLQTEHRAISGGAYQASMVAFEIAEAIRKMEENNYEPGSPTEPTNP